MAGRNSPWGSGASGGPAGGSGGEPSEPQEGEDRPAPESAPDGAPEAKGGSEGDKRGPRNPWLPSSDAPPPRRSASIEDIFRGRDPRRAGGPGRGGFPNLPRRPDGKSWVPVGIGVAVIVALGFASVHVLDPKEQGVVTTLGRYSRTLDSGTSLTLPWPIEQVKTVDVSTIAVDLVPEGDKERLLLTGDRNLVDLSYVVRWNIKNLKDYTFRLSDPDDTVREVAEAAMRAAIARVTLDEALSGEGRAKVENEAQARMQRILDYYRSGIAIQGVEIKKADPPAKTKAAFDQVDTAQQDAERGRAEARSGAQQLLARAQGEAAAFDKSYEQYKLSPEVTKRRMYYDVMEHLLRDNDVVIADAPGVNVSIPSTKRPQPPAQADTVVVTAPPSPSASGDR